MTQSLNNHYKQTNELAEIKNNQKETYLSASPFFDFFQGSLHTSSLKMNPPPSFPFALLYKHISN